MVGGTGTGTGYKNCEQNEKKEKKPTTAEEGGDVAFAQGTRAFHCIRSAFVLFVRRLSGDDFTIKYWQKFFEHNKINQIK